MVRQDKITQTFGRYGGGDVVQQPLQVNPETPGGADKVSVASLASRRKTRVQTIGRPPTRAQGMVSKLTYLFYLHISRNLPFYDFISKFKINSD